MRACVCVCVCACVCVCVCVCKDIHPSGKRTGSHTAYPLVGLQPLVAGATCRHGRSCWKGVCPGAGMTWLCVGALEAQLQALPLATTSQGQRSSKSALLDVVSLTIVIYNSLCNAQY